MGAVVFTEQLQGCDRGFDFVNPLFDIFFVFASLTLHTAYFFQHGFFSHFQKLVENLIIGTLGDFMTSGMI